MHMMQFGSFALFCHFNVSPVHEHVTEEPLLKSHVLQSYLCISVGSMFKIYCHLIGVTLQTLQREASSATLHPTLNNLSSSQARTAAVPSVCVFTGLGIRFLLRKLSELSDIQSNIQLNTLLLQIYESWSYIIHRPKSGRWVL